MNANKLMIALAGGLAGLSLYGAAEGVCYREDCDRFGNYTEVFNDGTDFIEAKNGVLGLVFKPNAASDFRKGFFPIATPPKGKDWKLSFLYAFPSPKTTAFAFKLYFGDRDNPDVRTLFVDERGSHFGFAPAAKPKDGMQGFLPCGRRSWNKGSVVVSGGKASFWVYRSGKLVKDCETAFPSEKLIGWNFGIPAEKGGEVHVDNVTVTDNCTRPYDRGDPTEWLEELAAAPRTPWDAAFGKPVTEKEPLAVDLAKEAVELNFRSPFTPDKRGNAQSVALVFNCETGKPCQVTFNPRASVLQLRTREASGGVFTNAVRTVKLPSEGLAIGGVGVRDREMLFTRPDIRSDERYHRREINEIWTGLEKLPAPKDAVFRVRALAVGENRIRVFVNDQVISEFTAPAKVVSVGVAGKEAEARARAVALKGPDDPQTYALPLPKEGFALERCRENFGSYDLESSGYLSRDALSYMPSSCLFNVPRRAWYRAKAVCRIDPAAPTNAIPVITARLTEFYQCGGRSLAMCEKTVDLLKDTANVVKKGDTYEVTFDLDVGSLQDLVFGLDGLGRRPLTYLHFEFLGPVWEKARYYMDPYRSPAESEFSSVRVLSAELVASPADMVATANGKFSLYYPDETAGATVTVTPRVPGDYTVEATVRDETGTVVETKREVVHCPVGSRVPRDRVDGNTSGTRDACPYRFSFEAKDYGWYSVDYVLYGTASGRQQEIMRHSASFVRLRPDTRKAGLESPYYSWNFCGSHGTPWLFDDWAEAFHRMGIRKTTVMVGPFNPRSNGKYRETSPECQKWQITHVQFPYVRDGNFATPKAWTNAFTQMKDMAERFPHSRSALVFHESGSGPFPKEVYGGITELDDDIRKWDAFRVKQARKCAETWRLVDPTIKLIHGNSSDTVGIVARLMRGGYPHELLDAWGEESVGMSYPPEYSTTMIPWTIRRLADIYGYTRAMDCPREWKSRYFTWRFEKDKSGAAAFEMRDALIAHALGYSIVVLDGGTETANSYADSIWCGGAFARWPLAYPRPVVAANAYLTQVLDCATFVRVVPTGSLTVYALEFKTEKGYVYTLWDARGETTASVNWAPRWGFLPKTGSGELVSMTGRVLKPRADGKIPVGEKVTYLVTGDRVESFAADLMRTFPAERYPGMENAVTAQALASADEIELSTMRDRRIEVPFAETPRRIGAYALHSVTDEVRGACVELKHLSQEKCPELMLEYATLRFKDPQPVPTPLNSELSTPNSQLSALGVWVKGNSNWGKIFFEFEDAEGEKWFSCGEGGVGCDVYDWGCRTAPNYEGWNFLQVPLRHGSPVKMSAPGDDEFQWTRDGHGNGRIDFPIKVTAVAVGLTGRTLNLLEMEKPSDTIRLGAVQVW